MSLKVRMPNADLNAAMRGIRLLHRVVKNQGEDSNARPAPQQGEASVVRTSRLKIPKFGGNRSRWFKFHDIFESVIHTKENLSNVEKFSYLVVAVKLPAGETNVLDNFKVCEVSDVRAIQCLQQNLRHSLQKHVHYRNDEE
jgi:hypothetical protein